MDMQSPPLIPVPEKIKNSTKKAGVFAPAFPITYYYSSVSILMLVITGISNGLFHDSGPYVGRSAIRSNTSNPDTSCPKAAYRPSSLWASACGS
mgnify:CR=1 FL=1